MACDMAVHILRFHRRHQLVISISCPVSGFYMDARRCMQLGTPVAAPPCGAPGLSPPFTIMAKTAVR